LTFATVRTPDPTEIGEFVANGKIDFMVDDITAVGRYYSDFNALTVFKKDSDGDFEAVAIVSEFYGYQEHYGAFPPYFLIGGKLWKMEAR
jgi:hypothetical protein